MLYCIQFLLRAACVLTCLTGAASADVSGKIRVIDGDTFEVSGVRIRLHGIDAPEIDQPCTTEQNTEWACGAWVQTQIAERYSGKQTHCSEVDRDRYGRVVARCTVAGQDVGRAIVADGLAFAYRRYSMDYDLDEKGAAINDRGLHASRSQTPAQFRATRAKGRIPPDKACKIKGNITKSGHIYHMPGQRDYERTGINTAKGERWFCNEAGALAAGWRKARR